MHACLACLGLTTRVLACWLMWPCSIINLQVLDIMHGLHALVWQEVPESPNFIQEYFAHYRWVVQHGRAPSSCVSPAIDG